MPKPKTPEIKTILLPVDMLHKEQSADAIAMAARLTKSFGAEFYVMTAAHPLGDEITEYPEHHKPEFEKYIQEMASAHGVSITALFRHHQSAEKMILDTAEEIKADLIVMHTHDPRITDHLFGSHASHIALHASCSVMVVR